MVGIPIGDDNSGRHRFPIVTVLLIAANAIAFYLELLGGEEFVLKWAFVPARLNENPAGEWVTVLTAMFLHGGWAHLIGNMLYLWVFGDNVEDRLGRLRYLMFYLAAGVIATFSQYATDPASPVPNVGASGAIAGVLGAYLVMFPRARVHVLLGRQVAPLPAYAALGGWFVLQLASGFGAVAETAQTENSEGGIAYAAHIGGFVAGFLLAGAIGAFRGPSRA